VEDIVGGAIFQGQRPEKDWGIFHWHLAYGPVKMIATSAGHVGYLEMIMAFVRSWRCLGLTIGLVGMLTSAALFADQAENQSIKAVEKLGGVISRDDKARGKPIVGVDLGATEVTDAALKELAGLRQLRKLSLASTQVTDAGLKAVARLRTLQTLDLGGTKITGATLKDLAALKRLQKLDLISTQVTDAGLKGLAALKQLQTLTLDSTPLTDAGLKTLAELRLLRTLSLNSTEISDAGLKELVKLKRLQTLSLKETQVTDEGVESLQKALPKLKIVR
jgi:hypothetical protein